MIDPELIKRVAQNARLRLSDSEIKEFLPQLAEILEHFKTLNEIDVKGLSPSWQPVKLADVMRADQPGRCLSVDQVLKNTPHRKNSSFKGPRVF